MAKKEEKPKIVLERTYNIPLRKEFLKVPRYKRSKKAIVGLRKFLTRHMKSDNLKIGPYLNELIWQHGIRNPPHHVQVTVVKDDQGVVRAELVGKPIFEPTVEETKKGKGAKKEEKAKGTAEDKKAEKKATKDIVAEQKEEKPVEAAPEAQEKKPVKPKSAKTVKAEEESELEVVIEEETASEEEASEEDAEEKPADSEEPRPKKPRKKAPKPE
jgi:large subunit ribosomal protein L31e